MVVKIKQWDVIIDDEDYDKVMSHVWTPSRIGREQPHPYFRRFHRVDGVLKTKEYLHRMLIDAPEDMYVDHINQNTLDNRKSNLRLCTGAQNMRNRKKYRTNSTGYRGVCYHKRDKRYQAMIKVDGKKMYLGYFLTAEEAHAAYCVASQKYHGEFGCTE